MPLWVLCSVFALICALGYLALRGTLGSTTETTLSAYNDVVKLAPKQANLTIALSWPRSTECEAVSELFSFDIDALSMSTDLDLADFIGEELTITLLQPDGRRRAWHGLCTDAGGLARYRLHLQPALALMGCGATAISSRTRMRAT